MEKGLCIFFFCSVYGQNYTFVMDREVVSNWKQRFDEEHTKAVTLAMPKRKMEKCPQELSIVVYYCVYSSRSTNYGQICCPEAETADRTSDH